MNGVEINVDTLLFGNDFLSDETNCEIKIANNDPHFRFGIHIYSLDLKLN
jgi:hypothetical protein